MISIKDRSYEKIHKIINNLLKYSNFYIFITTTGEYLGEIVYGNVLIKNTQSEYVNIELGTQPTIPTAPIPRTAPTRATVPTLPSWYLDI